MRKINLTLTFVIILSTKPDYELNKLEKLRKSWVETNLINWPIKENNQTLKSQDIY